jgi:hypothetical protein
MPRHVVEEGETASEREEEEHGVVLAGMRLERMRTTSSWDISQMKGYGLWFGLVDRLLLGYLVDY